MYHKLTSLWGTVRCSWKRVTAKMLPSEKILWLKSEKCFVRHSNELLLFMLPNHKTVHVLVWTKLTIPVIVRWWNLFLISLFNENYECLLRSWFRSVNHKIINSQVKGQQNYGMNHTDRTDLWAHRKLAWESQTLAMKQISQRNNPSFLFYFSCRPFRISVTSGVLGSPDLH